MTTSRARARLLIPTALATLALGLTACSDAETSESTTQSSTSAPTSTIASATSTTAATPTSRYPVSVSSCGRTFTYDRAPSRVVLGNYRTLKTLDALGVADAVTGYVLGPDDRGVAPTNLPARLTLVSKDTVPAREPVIAAQPDLFLSFNEVQLVGQGTLSYADLASIKSNAYVMGAYCTTASNNRSIDTVYADIDNLGAIFGVPDRAAALNAKLRDRVAAAKASLGGATPTVAFLKVVAGKVFAIGGYPVSATLGALGLGNQFANLPTAFAPLNAEQALAMKPDLIFVSYVGDEKVAIADLAAALPDLAAVKEGRVRGADENLGQGSGVGIIDSLEALAAAVKGAKR